MPSCKNCGSEGSVQNGIVRKKQRYRCQSCGYNFVEGDDRIDPDTAVKRAFAVILYSVGKSSYGFIARLFGVTPPAVLKWIRQEAAALPDPAVPGSIKEMEFDEMWHFLHRKKTKDGSSKPWIPAFAGTLQAELSPGLSAVVMLQRSKGFTIK